MSVRPWIASALGLAVVTTAACSKPPEQKTPPVPVELAAVSTIAAPLTIESNGVVEPTQTVTIQGQVTGTIQNIGFEEGQDVQAGQTLFQLDPRPFEAALHQSEAQLARDEANADNAKRDADRYRTLAEKDYVTKSQADQQLSAATAAKATVDASRAAVENARINLSYATIKSPIAGRTGRVLVKAGNLVKANTDPLVVINTLHPVLVRFPVSQRDFPALQRRNMKGNVPVRVTTADSGKVAEPGSLAFMDNAVDSLTGTVTAKARFENQTNALWPGEYVRVSVELNVEPNATAVPTRAVLASQDGNYVFVVGNDRIAKVRTITPGRVVGTFTTIDKGLAMGEQVVVDGQSRLTPNAHVDLKGEKGGAGKTTQAGSGR
ncbi:MAG TPA: efflux RND transporter periplasmic adaptor subunit [Gemmatimonadaceae bacterium]